MDSKSLHTVSWHFPRDGTSAVHHYLHKKKEKLTRPNKKNYTYEEKQFLIKCLSSAVSAKNNDNDILFW